MIFIDIFIFKINEIIFLIIVYHNFEDLVIVKDNYNTNYNSLNSLDLMVNEYSDQENWLMMNSEK